MATAGLKGGTTGTEIQIGGTTYATLRTDGMAIPAAAAAGDAMRKDQTVDLTTAQTINGGKTFTGLLQQTTTVGSEYALFQSSAASSESAVRIDSTQTSSGSSLKISNSGNNNQASVRLNSSGGIDIYTAQTAGSVSTSGGLQVNVLQAPSTNRSITLTGSNGGNPTIGVSGGNLALSGVVNTASATATPAGGSTAAVLLFGTTAGFGIYYGSGVPTVSAAAGSLYIRTDNAGANLRLYSNTTGSTVWAAITSA